MFSVKFFHPFHVSMGIIKFSFPLADGAKSQGWRFLSYSLTWTIETDVEIRRKGKCNFNLSIFLLFDSLLLWFFWLRQCLRNNIKYLRNFRLHLWNRLVYLRYAARTESFDFCIFSFSGEFQWSFALLSYLCQQCREILDLLIVMIIS